MTPVALLFPADQLVALVFEEELAGLSAHLTAVYAEFPGGLPPWFVHVGEGESVRQLRALGSAQAGRVPFLPRPETVTVVVTCADGRDVHGDGPSIALAFGEALRFARAG